MNARALLLLLALATCQGAQAEIGVMDRLRGLIGLGGGKARMEDTKKVMPRIRVGTFSGGTGASAQQALRKELLDSREFFVADTDEKADFVVEGTSVGGRVDGRLRDAKGKDIFRRSYAAPGLDENLKALTDDVIYTVTGRPGLATSRIVFVSDHSGKRQIYVCDAEGGDVLGQDRRVHRLGRGRPLHR